MASEAQKTIGNYSLGDVIGKGSQGDVYKGLNRLTGDLVAIKQVKLTSVKDVDAAMMEIELLGQLHHPNIVRYVATHSTSDALSIVLEYVEGGALSNVLKKFGCLPESLLRTYARQVLGGLAYLHREGVIHRDIKGSNILVTKDGEVKLADFGVASRLSKDEGGEGDDPVAGTPYWMPPEVISLSGVTTSSDIWSFGCTLIELVTGAPPYFDLQPMSALFRIVQDSHPPLPPMRLTSDKLRDFLLRCFHKDPKTRPSAEELLLHPWLDDSTFDESETLHHRSGSFGRGGSFGRDSESQAAEVGGTSADFRGRIASQEIDLNPIRGLGSQSVAMLGSADAGATAIGGWHLSDRAGSRSVRSLAPSEPSMGPPTDPYLGCDDARLSASSPEAQDLRAINCAREQLEKVKDEGLPAEVHLEAINELAKLLRANDVIEDVIRDDHGLLPLKRLMLAHPPSSKIFLAILRIVSKMIEGESAAMCETLCLCGFLPHIAAAASSDDLPTTTRHLAVYFVWKLCHASNLTLHMYVACDGLKILSSFVAADWTRVRKVVRMGIQSLWRVLEVDMAIPRSDLCSELADSGVLLHATELLQLLSDDDGNDAPVLLLRITALILAFADPDVLTNTVRDAFLAPGVLERITRALQPGVHPPPAQLNLLRAVAALSEDANAQLVDALRGAGLVPCLTSQLSHSVSHNPSLPEHTFRSLVAVSNLCQLSSPHQEQAALAGIVPLLQAIVAGGAASSSQAGTAYKSAATATAAGSAGEASGIALALLCDFGAARHLPRKILCYEHGGVDFLVTHGLYNGNILWRVRSFEVLALWLADQDGAEPAAVVEHSLLEPAVIRAILDLFVTEEGAEVESLLAPLSLMLQASLPFRKALGVTTLLPRLCQLLQCQDASIKVAVLKIVRLVVQSQDQERRRITGAALRPIVAAVSERDDALLVRELSALALQDFG